MSTLTNKVALITGASRGIGAEIAREFALRGAKVVVNYNHSAAAAEALVAEIKRKDGDAISVQADVSNPEEIKRLFLTAVSHFNRLDIVISNSGVEHFAPLSEVTPDDFDRVFSVNTRGQYFVAQEAFAHLAENGRLILTGSISAHMPLQEHAIYAGSKCAVEAFARCFAVEFASRGITVNSVAPGGVKTDMAAEFAYKYTPGGRGDATWTMEQIEAMVAAQSPRGRMGRPGDIAPVVAFLASEDAGWISGQNIVISGGR